MKYDYHALRGDFFGGVTSAIVALPVALAFGVASGLGAAAGLYSAIAVGFFAAVFGGTRSQISGPTAPMTVAMAAILTTHSATLAEAMIVVIMAGAAADRHGRAQDRPLRRVHAGGGRVRLHVRDRHHPSS